MTITQEKKISPFAVNSKNHCKIESTLLQSREYLEEVDQSKERKRDPSAKPRTTDIALFLLGIKRSDVE